jgi:hypothetical protein
MLVCALTASPLALAADNGAEATAKPQATRRITVKVGASAPLGYMPAQTVCDDASILRVSDAKSGASITGVKPGKTLCGFYKDVGTGLFRELVEVTVVP